MKKLATLLLIMICCIGWTKAQTSLYFDPSFFGTCTGATNSITPHVGTVPGLSPPDSSFPCLPVGQMVHDTLYFKNYSTFSGLTVNSIKFDSIYLPTGLCWSTNKANNTFATGEDGVLFISGTPTGAYGNYKLRIIADFDINAIGALNNVDLEAIAHVRYHMRLVCGSNPCLTLNPADTVNVFTADNRTCGTPPPLTASISPSGPDTICTGDTMQLLANYGVNYRYLWSTGDTTRSIFITGAGSYTVTVSDGSSSLASAPTQIIANSNCPVYATISPAGPITICNGSSQSLYAATGNGYTYQWSTGQTASAITVSSGGVYRVTVTRGAVSAVDSVVVSVSSVCNVSYYDPTFFGSCAASTNTVASVPQSAPGMYPPDSQLPCMSAGGRMYDTIYFKNYTTFSGFALNNVKFDSIYLPAGLCWSTNKANNTFLAGEDGIILISGTPTAPAGSYKLKIVVDINTNAINLQGVDLEPILNQRYHVRIACSNSGCPSLNPADSSSLFSPDTSVCSSSLAANIYPSGPTTICGGDSVTLTASYGYAFTYLWSSGETTRSITVGNSGSYTVTVSYAGNSVVSSPVQVTVNNNCTPNATISPAGPVNICNGASQVLSAPFNGTYQYHWNTGQSTQSITVSTPGTYSVTVTSGTASATSSVAVTSNGCNVSYGNALYFSACNNGTNGITPSVGTVPGLAPADSSLPCMVAGNVGYDTIYFKNYSVISGLNVNSIKLDSIYLPAGLCWSTNKANNTFAGGEDGIILFSGTPTAPAGIYKLRIVADFNVGGINLSNMDMEQILYLRYHLRIRCSSSSCLPVNPADSISIYTADNSCGTAVTAAISGGPFTICSGTSVTLYANTTGASSYVWSTGATSSSISVSSTGTYGLTAYGNSSSAAASPVTVTITPGPHAQFSLVQDPSAPHTWAAVDQSTGSSPLSYVWAWGDGFSSTGATPAHTYDSAGYYTICVSVTDSTGCSDAYCDSNTYLYKADGQMISLRVVQYPLGMTEINGAAAKMSYYGGAVHFSEAITEPSDITLYDMSGRVVMSRRNWTGATLPLDDSLADGVYVVSCQNSAMRLAGRIGLVR